jgi:flagellar hook assembly protein FlgD
MPGMILWLTSSSGKTSGPLITRVGCTPKTIDVQKNETAQIAFTLTGKANVWLEIKDEEQQVIYREKPAKAHRRGDHVFKWNGVKNHGEPVQAGVYTYVLHAGDKKGKQETYDPRGETWGLPIHVRSIDYDKEKGMLSYTMPRAGRTRIRIGLKDGPLMKTLIDWEPQEGGVQEIYWDGTDKDGLVQMKENPGTFIMIHAYSLADNSIIVKDKGQKPVYDKKGPLIRGSVPTITPSGERRYFHAVHSAWVCREPEAIIRLPGASKKENRWVISSVQVPITIDAPPESRRMLIESRFEVVIFVDGVFIMEDEEGYFPYTYMWDTSSLNPGDHLLTVNLVSYEDHIAVKTLQVTIIGNR